MAKDATSEKLNVLDVIANSCRLCMARDTAKQHIFSQGRQDIVERIYFCTGIQLIKEDSLPSQICTTCLKNLAISHQFKTTCIEADVTFRKLITINIKTEVELDPTSDANIVKDEDIDSEHITEELWDIIGQNEFEIKMEENKQIYADTERKPLKKRGPYKKNGKPRRIRKFKFSRLKCDVCDIKFANKAESEDHKKNSHKEETFICEVCGKVFVHRSSHHSHVRSHLPPNYSCDKCDYKTVYKYDLVKHIRVHADIKQYQCEYCTTAYRTSSNLMSHIKRLHEGVKRFQCHLCDRQFYDRTKLNRHVDSHNDIKRYECEMCQSCFTRRCYWKKHLYKQHGVVVPAQRPGRRRTNLLIGEFTKQVTLTSDKSDKTVQ